MMDVPVSAELRDLLHRKMTCGTTVGADVSQRMKWANDLIDDGAITEDHPPSGGEEFRPNKKLRVRIVRALPFLAVIDGGLG